jgi:tRNA (adenine57-N1/adenine58-N1)-methyltransferase
MICAQQHNVVRSGDLVVLHGGFKFLIATYVTPGENVINQFGTFRHDDMVGRSFGSVVGNTRGTNSLVLLRPTPELWSVTLRHRTQIVFSMDASVIAFRMNLRPGSVVVETGTGSGALSHHFVRRIQPNGHLHTFEFNAQRATLAREEFAKNGLTPFVTVQHADAYVDGFGDHLQHRANAVFLDLPMPWKAVAHAKRALAANGVLCSFSPCVEQVRARACVYVCVRVCVRALCVRCACVCGVRTYVHACVHSIDHWHSRAGSPHARHACAAGPANVCGAGRGRLLRRVHHRGVVSPILCQGHQHRGTVGAEGEAPPKSTRAKAATAAATATATTTAGVISSNGTGCSWCSSHSKG